MIKFSKKWIRDRARLNCYNLEKSNNQTSADQLQLHARKSDFEKNGDQEKKMDSTELERIDRLNPEILRDQGKLFFSISNEKRETKLRVKIYKKNFLR